MQRANPQTPIGAARDEKSVFFCVFFFLRKSAQIRTFLALFYVFLKKSATNHRSSSKKACFGLLFKKVPFVHFCAHFVCFLCILCVFLLTFCAFFHKKNTLFWASGAPIFKNTKKHKKTHFVKSVYKVCTKCVF